MIKKLYTRIKRLFVYDEYDDVRAFYEKFGQPQGAIPSLRNMHRARVMERIAFMQEELKEYQDALMASDLDGMADALIDLVYVAKGTAIEMGLPWEPLWQDVQRANMAKVKGKTKRGIEIDVAKPPGWKPPNTREILKAYGATYVEYDTYLRPGGDD